MIRQVSALSVFVFTDSVFAKCHRLDRINNGKIETGFIKEADQAFGIDTCRFKSKKKFLFRIT